MKKLTLSLVTASLAVSSLGAYAALPTTAAPFQVVVPNLASGLELTLEGLYLQPSSSDLSFATTKVVASSNTAYTIHYLDPDYNFGFRAALGYIFPDSGNDVQLSWTHFDHSDDATVVGVDADGYSNTDLTTFTSNVDFKYNAIDLDVGQFVSIGTRLQSRLFIGLRGAELRMDRSDTHVTQDSGGTAIDTGTSTSNSKFIGIGPRVGIDTSYHISNCFGIVGHFATALLVGNVDASAAYAGFFINQQPTTTSYTADTQTRVVPAFDAKLGLDYTILFNNSAAISGSSLSIEAGYQVTQYIDAIDRIGASEDYTSPSSGKGAQDGGFSGVTTTSSLGFHGPYLSLNFKI